MLLFWNPLRKYVLKTTYFGLFLMLNLIVQKIALLYICMYEVQDWMWCKLSSLSNRESYKQWRKFSFLWKIVERKNWHGVVPQSVFWMFCEHVCRNRRLSIVSKFHLYPIPFKPPRFESVLYFPFSIYRPRLFLYFPTLPLVSFLYSPFNHSLFPTNC